MPHSQMHTPSRPSVPDFVVDLIIMDRQTGQPRVSPGEDMAARNWLTMILLDVVARERMWRSSRPDMAASFACHGHSGNGRRVNALFRPASGFQFGRPFVGSEGTAGASKTNRAR